MIRALAYLLRRRLLNRIRFGLPRLLQLRFALPALVALLYFGCLLSSLLVRPAEPVMEPDRLRTAASTGLTFFLLWAILSPWVLVKRTPALTFTEAETQILFQAPLSRRTLLGWRLVRSQPPLLVLATIIGLLGIRRADAVPPILAGLGFYLVLNVILLYQSAASLAVASILRHRTAALRRRVLAIALPAVVVGSIALSFELPGGSLDGFGDVLVWVGGILGEGPAGVVLWPVRRLAALPLSPDLATFAARLPVVLGLLSILGIWVVRSDAAFEDAALDKARRLARRQETGRKGGLFSSGEEVGRAWLPLAPTGPVWRAIAWREAVRGMRVLSPALVLVVGAVVAGGLLLVPEAEGLRAWLPVWLAALVPWGARRMFLDGLRGALDRVDRVRMLPLSGRTLVGAQVAGAALYPVLIQLGLVGIGLAHADPAHRLALGAAGAVLPTLTVLFLVAAQGLTVVFPGWVAEESDDPEKARGIEQIGERILGGVGQVVVVGALSVVPILLGVGTGLTAGILAGPRVGVGVGVGAGVLAALAEAGALVLWIGSAWDRLDLSEEGL